MAKVMFSTAVGDLRNKAGGAVFTKTRFGSMVRRKVSPVQPRSSYQMNVRANFTDLSKLWSHATMLNYRAAWIGLADSYPVKDVFGQTQRLSGHQFFVKLNRQLATVGFAPILAPPATLIVPYGGTLAVAKAGGPPITTLTLDLSAWPATGEYILFSATAGISPGRASAGARFRHFDHALDYMGHPYDVLTKYTAKFGTPIAGRKVFFRAFILNVTTGAMSLPSEASITI